LRIALIVAAAALMAGHLQRAFDWAEAWHLEQKLPAEAPVPEMIKMEVDAAVLVVKPFTFNSVPTFSEPWDINSAPWDINPAMENTHPATAGHKFIVYNFWLGPDTMAIRRIAIISSSRSGNTWVRFALADALELEHIGINNYLDAPGDSTLALV
jgi:hypothetical protein